MTQADHYKLVELKKIASASAVHTFSVAESYQRSAPTRIHVGDAAANEFLHYFDKRSGSLPASQLFAIPDCLVEAKGTMLSGQAVLADNLEGAPVQKILEALRSNSPVPVRTIDDPLLYTSRYGVKNYGHCLTDIAPRIVAAHRLDPELKIAIHPEFVKTALDAILDFGVDATKLVLLDEQPTLLREARFVSPCNAHPLIHSPAALALIRSRTQALVSKAGAMEQRPRLFVTRNDASSRHLTNHEDVAKALRKLGYAEVTTGNLAHAQQAALFNQASEIVAIAGASMTNIVYCRPGTKVTLLSPSTMSALYFWDIASQLGLDFRIGYFPTAQAAQEESSLKKLAGKLGFGASATSSRSVPVKHPNSIHSDFEAAVSEVLALQAD